MKTSGIRASHPRSLGLVPLLLCVVVVAAGCASDDGTDNDPSSSSTSAALEAQLTPTSVPGVATEMMGVETVYTSLQDNHPFQDRRRAPDFPPDAEWLNTGGPLRLADLKGKFVLLDFWTYCCINCIHILPELKKLEKAYPNELVVIGVHSAKFATEQDSKNIEEAILRYEIEHPVVNDANHRIWNLYGVNSWPSIRLIDPEGNLVAGDSGEFRFEAIDEFFKKKALPYYRRKKLLDETPLRFELLAARQAPTPLRFPGKILADEPGGRLFISDSNHNRIVVTSLDGKLQDIIGSSEIGRRDGAFDSCSFDHPQGCVLRGDTLYVADTENHSLRKVDLKARTVTTIAGTGEQTRVQWPGMDRLQLRQPPPRKWNVLPKTAGLNSPWALWIHEDDLYIAMAGPHQIWKMDLEEKRIGPYAGNGREDIVDGQLLPDQPYGMAAPGEMSFSSFAQPSGLASDGKWLYVADTEGSSIRAVPFGGKGSVLTVVGTSKLPQNRLFTFGDRDGVRERVLLQHAIGVTHHDGKLFVTDTYNNKIKVISPQTGETTTLAGDGKPGDGDSPARFDEPAGIAYAAGKLYVADTNNHRIRTVDPQTGDVKTLKIEGLTPPAKSTQEQAPSFQGIVRRNIRAGKVKPVDGAIALKVQLQLPPGWKINDLAPLNAWTKSISDGQAIDRSQLGKREIEPRTAQFDLSLPVTGTGDDKIEVGIPFYYCMQGSEGICKMGVALWEISLIVDPAGKETPIELNWAVIALP